MTNRLWETLDYLNDHGWCKMGFRQSDGSCCLLGASRMVHLGHVHTGGQERETAEDILAMRSVINEQFPDRVANEVKGTMYEVASFNNHDDTTLDDVRLVVQKAATRADEILA